VIAADEAEIGVLMRLPACDDRRLGDAVSEVLRLRITERCRHEAGHSYLIGKTTLSGPDGYDDVVVFVDAREGKQLEVSRSVVRAVFDLAETGPTADELEHLRQVWDEELADPDAAMGEQVHTTMHGLLGLAPHVAVDRDSVRALSAEDVRDCVRDALSSVVFCVPEDVAEEVVSADLPMLPACAVEPECPTGRTFRPVVAARAFSSDARATTLFHTATGLTLVDREGHHVVDWPDVVGVMRHDDKLLFVYGAGGCVIPVGNGLFRRSQPVYDEVVSRVDPALVFEAPPELRQS
jgi:hypothetical protein